MQHGHVVVCVFGDESSNLIGLQNLVRSDQIPTSCTHEIKKSVLAADSTSSSKFEHV